MPEPTKKPPISAEQFEKICQIIENQYLGTEKACAAAGSHGAYLRRYLQVAGETASIRYTRACSIRHEHYAEEIAEIADSKGDARDKQVRIDARKWLLSKLIPKKYGDRLELAGDQAALPTKIKVELVQSKKK